MCLDHREASRGVQRAWRWEGNPRRRRTVDTRSGSEKAESLAELRAHEFPPCLVTFPPPNRSFCFLGLNSHGWAPSPETESLSDPFRDVCCCPGTSSFAQGALPVIPNSCASELLALYSFLRIHSRKVCNRLTKGIASGGVGGMRGAGKGTDEESTGFVLAVQVADEQVHVTVKARPPTEAYRPGGNPGRGKWMVSFVNSHTNATSKRWHLW